jgi:hypothetical protein
VILWLGPLRHYPGADNARLDYNATGRSYADHEESAVTADPDLLLDGPADAAVTVRED